MDMCAFNKKPEDDVDGNQLCKKRIAIVTKRNEDAKNKLEKTCPGIIGRHQHVHAMGKATKIDRSTESEVYSEEFAEAICDTALSIHRTLKQTSGNAETTPPEVGGGVYCGCKRTQGEEEEQIVRRSDCEPERDHATAWTFESGRKEKSKEEDPPKIQGPEADNENVQKQKRETSVQHGVDANDAKKHRGRRKHRRSSNAVK